LTVSGDLKNLYANAVVALVFTDILGVPAIFRANRHAAAETVAIIFSGGVNGHFLPDIEAGVILDGDLGAERGNAGGALGRRTTQLRRSSLHQHR
jgi:hypothetical protein